MGIFYHYPVFKLTRCKKQMFFTFKLSGEIKTKKKAKCWFNNILLFGNLIRIRKYVKTDACKKHLFFAFRGKRDTLPFFRKKTGQTSFLLHHYVKHFLGCKQTISHDYLNGNIFIQHTAHKFEHKNNQAQYECSKAYDCFLNFVCFYTL